MKEKIPYLSRLSNLLTILPISSFTAEILPRTRSALSASSTGRINAVLPISAPGPVRD